MLFKSLLFCGLLSVVSMAEAPQQPNLDKQRSAMSKLQFLVGSWAGAGRRLRSPSEWMEVTQTEEAKYKLDGLLLTVEGVGKNKADGSTVLQAFGLISYDDAADVYRMRAFNDGRWLETEVQLDETGKALHWGFTFGNIKTSSTLRINAQGDWTEVHELTIGSEPARKFMELTVKRRM
jgi:hypothetical protein